MVIWIIGLSGAGKTTLAKQTVKLMTNRLDNVVLLDGDVVRQTFGDDLGHSLEDRKKNADRLCRMSKFLDDQGINVVCAILSIFEESREWNRESISNYYEVFIDVPVEILIKRDSKGLYARALKGEIKDFPGVNFDFPVPAKPDLVVRNNGSKEALLEYAEGLAALGKGRCNG